MTATSRSRAVSMYKTSSDARSASIGARAMRSTASVADARTQGR